MTITFEPLNETARLMLANGLEDALQRMNHSTDSLHADLDRLAIQVEKLVTERQHIIDVLSDFYKSDISMSALQPILSLAVALNPSLKI